MNDLNHCIVARIMHGGMIHRQGAHTFPTLFTLFQWANLCYLKEPDKNWPASGTISGAFLL